MANTMPLLLVFGPLFGLALALFGALSWRSARNRAEPPQADASGRTRLLWLIAGALIFAASLYFRLRRTHYTPSWDTTLWTAIFAFLIGDAWARWDTRRTAGKDAGATSSS